MITPRLGTLLSILLVSCSGPAAPSPEPAEAAPSIDWVAIESGCFTMGSEEGYADKRPVRDVCVDGFLMARTEITNAQFAAFVAATGYATRAERGWAAAEPAGPGIDVPPGGAVFISPKDSGFSELSWWRLVAGANWRWPTGPDGPAARDSDPVVQITLEDAEAFAAWAGARLPSEAEWEYAAKAGAGQDEGTVPGGGRVRTQREKANTWQGVFPLINTGDDGFEGIAPVASYPANAFGLHDMIGNVWEWTASPYAPSHGAQTVDRAGERGFDPGQPGVAVGVVKGGSFLCTANYCARFRPAARHAQDLAFSTSHVGFRLVKQ